MRIYNENGYFMSNNISYYCDLKSENYTLKRISSFKKPHPCFGLITRNIFSGELYSGKVILHFTKKLNAYKEVCLFDIDTIKFFIDHIKKYISFDYVIRKNKNREEYYDICLTFNNNSKIQIYFVLNMVRRLYNHPQAEFLKVAIDIHKEKGYDLFDLLMIGDRIDPDTHPDNLLCCNITNKPLKINKNTFENTLGIYRLTKIVASKCHFSSKGKTLIFNARRDNSFIVFHLGDNRYKKALIVNKNNLEQIYKILRKC